MHIFWLESHTSSADENNNASDIAMLPTFLFSSYKSALLLLHINNKYFQTKTTNL